MSTTTTDVVDVYAIMDQTHAALPVPIATLPLLPTTIVDQSALVSLPTELLLEILYQLDDESLLAVKHTSSLLHTFIASNAPHIANMIINRNFPVEASLFKPEHSPSGYLIPTHPCILAGENHTRQYIIDRTTELAESIAQTLAQEDFLLTTRLSRPGLAFLQFLRSRKNLWVEANLLRRGDVTEQVHSKRLERYYVTPYLDKANCSSLFAQKGLRSRKNSFLRA